jgi:D-inositol-3-phosphate glycosyltransferase
MREERLLLGPSHSETYRLLALEAAASGVPVVAAASGGLPEAVDDGVTGVVVSSREPEEWAGAITEILSNPELERRLGTAARERADRFDWARSGERLLDVYAELLRGGGRA